MGRPRRSQAPPPFCWRIQRRPAHLRYFSKRPPGKKHHGPAVSASGFPPSPCTPQGGARVKSRRAHRGHQRLSVGWLHMHFLIQNHYQLLSIHKVTFKFPGTKEGPASSSLFSVTPCAPVVLKCPRPGHPLMSRSLELSGLQLAASFTQSDRCLPSSAHPACTATHAQHGFGVPWSDPSLPPMPLFSRQM